MIFRPNVALSTEYFRGRLAPRLPTFAVEFHRANLLPAVATLVPHVTFPAAHSERVLIVPIQIAIGANVDTSILPLACPTQEDVALQIPID